MIVILGLLQIIIVVLIIAALKNENIKEKLESLFNSEAVKKSKDIVKNTSKQVEDDFEQIKEAYAKKDYSMNNISVDTATDWDDEVYKEYDFNDVRKAGKTERYGVVNKEKYREDIPNELSEEPTNAPYPDSTEYNDSVDISKYRIKEKQDENLTELNFDSDDLNLE